MTVKKKATKPKYKTHQRDIDDVIERGGKVSADSKNQPTSEAETRFTLRIPKKLVVKIDRECEKKVGNVSRNQWILEAIADRLD